MDPRVLARASGGVYGPFYGMGGIRESDGFGMMGSDGTMGPNGTMGSDGIYRPYDTRAGSPFKIGGRTGSSEAEYGPDGKLIRNSRLREADGQFLEPAIARWFLDEEGHHLRCEHPVLGTLGIVPIIELPPEWFERQFSFRTFYQHEIYTVPGEDGVELLDLSSDVKT